jgi:hypothetical protein
MLCHYVVSLCCVITLCHCAERHSSQCLYAEFVPTATMLRVIIPNAVKLSVVILSLIILCQVTMWSANMLSIVVVPNINAFPYFPSPGTSGRIRTRNLKIISRVFYHCAPATGQSYFILVASSFSVPTAAMSSWRIAFLVWTSRSDTGSNLFPPCRSGFRYHCPGSAIITGGNIEVVWAEFSTLS